MNKRGEYAQMKKEPAYRYAFSLLFLLCLFLTSCYEEKVISIPPAEVVKEEETAEVQPEVKEEDDEVMDLTFMSGTALYSQVLNMISDPASYEGRTVRLRGYFALGEDGEGNMKFGCIIPDATACCAQGFSFVLKEGNWPDDYPEPDQWFELEGTFTYTETEYFVDVTLSDASILNIIG